MSSEIQSNSLKKKKNKIELRKFHIKVLYILFGFQRRNGRPTT